MQRLAAATFLVLMPIVALAAGDNALARFVTLSPPDCVGPGNLIAEDSAAPSGTYIRVQHIGDPGTAELAGEVANPVTWNVGELTGFDARDFPGAQRGHRNAGLPVGTSAFQLYCDQAGFLINTWQFSHAAALFGEGPSVSISRALTPPATPFRNGGALMIEAEIRVPWIHNEQPPVVEGTAQVSFYFYALDSKSGKYIAQLVQVFDNRPAGLMGNGAENVNYDGVVNFASSPLASFDGLGHQVRFVTAPPGSARMQYQYPWSETRHFQALVTYANFAAVLEGLRSQRQPELSPEPSDYTIPSFGVLVEVFPGTGNANNVSIGGSVARLALREIPLPARPNRP